MIGSPNGPGGPGGPGGGGGCLLAGTPVRTRRGRLVPIERLALGAELIGPAGTWGTVTHRWAHAPSAGPVYRLTTASGASLVVSGNHRLAIPRPAPGPPGRCTRACPVHGRRLSWRVLPDGREVLAEAGRWFARADTLQVGDVVCRADRSEPLATITPLPAGAAVYDVTVPPTHVYQAGGWWVHNALHLLWLPAAEAQEPPMKEP